MPTINIPEPPTREENIQARTWVRWFQELKRALATQVTAAVDWVEINFTGSSLADLATRSHTDLQNLNTTDHTHLTAAQATDLTDAGDSILHYHASDRDSANFTGTNWTDLTDGGETTLNSHAFTFKSAASVTLNTGTGTGSVTDLQTMLDGNVYNIAEAASTPGFDLEVAFATVTRIRGVQVRTAYMGSDVHWVQVELRNYDSSAWDVIFTFNHQEGFQTQFVWLPDDANYIDGSGNAAVRIYHVTAGNAAHDIDIDFVGLLE